MVKTHWQKAGKSALAFMGSVSHSGAVLAEWLMNLILIPVITFYLLRDWDILVAKVHELLPRRAAPTAVKLGVETNVVLGAFMRGQFYVMLALGTIYSVGLWIVGLDLALLIGMLAGLVSFVPYLGSIVGITVACIAALLQFHDFMYLIPVSIVFVVGQLVEGMLLTPLLVGDKIGLHPVAVMFAVLAGGQLFGFLGILLALPVASVIMVILRHIHEIYRDSVFYSAEDM
jgi:predicted PurR-regulated permease PerM